MDNTGAVLHFNDDLTSAVNTDSGIEETLESGSYTIEATTYESGVTESFTLTISGIK